MADWPLASTPQPEFVYLVVTTTEWPVDAIADGPHAVHSVDRVVAHRLESGNVHGDRSRVKVFRARITDLEEVELLPSTVVGPQLRPRGI